MINWTVYAKGGFGNLASLPAFVRCAAAFLVLALISSTAAWAGQPLAPDDLKRGKMAYVVAAVIVGSLCLLLGALIALILGLRRNRSYFAVCTVLFTLIIATVGWFTGVIPVLLGVVGIIFSGGVAGVIFCG